MRLDCCVPVLRMYSSLSRKVLTCSCSCARRRPSASSASSRSGTGLKLGSRSLPSSSEAQQRCAQQKPLRQLCALIVHRFIRPRPTRVCTQQRLSILTVDLPAEARASTSYCNSMPIAVLISSAA